MKRVLEQELRWETAFRTCLLAAFQDIDVSSYIERLKSQIGTTFHSDWVEIDQGMIQCFADVTQDQQYIHVDPVRAAASPFGGTVAHGFLTLSLLTHLRELTPELNPTDIRMGINYGFEKIRFISPVKAGSRIRAQWNTISVEAKESDTYHIHDKVEVEIDGESKPALAAVWIARVIM